MIFPDFNQYLMLFPLISQIKFKIPDPLATLLLKGWKTEV